MWSASRKFAAHKLKIKQSNWSPEKPQRTWHTLRADEVRFMGGNQIDMRIDGAATF